MLKATGSFAKNQKAQKEKTILSSNVPIDEEIIPRNHKNLFLNKISSFEKIKIFIS